MTDKAMMLSDVSDSAPVLDVSEKVEAGTKKDLKQDQEKKVSERLEKEIKKNIIKIKSGDSDFDLDLDWKIPVTIDKEQTEITLAELRNDYSGKQAWNKKHADLGNEKKSFRTEKETFFKELTDTAMSLKNADFESALYHIARASGEKNPSAIVKSFLENAVLKLAEDLNGHEKDSWPGIIEGRFKDFERKRLEKENVSYRNQMSMAQTERVLESKKTEFGLNDKEIIDAYDELTKEKENLRPDLQKIEIDDIVERARSKKESLELFKDVDGEVKEKALGLYKRLEKEGDLKSPMFKGMDKKEIEELILKVVGKPKLTERDEQKPGIKEGSNLARKIKTEQLMPFKKTEQDKSALLDDLF